MDATELLANRRSISKLKEPAPPADVVERVVRSALRAPDHGALRPWKVLMFRGEAREKLGAILEASLLRRHPTATADERARERAKVTRAPLLFAVAATIKESPKAPEVEQLLSAGCVMHGLLLGFSAEGFGAVWKTGAPVYDPEVRAGLGLAVKDQLLGFLYVGSIAEEPPTLVRPEPSAFLVDWNG
jgi:nitroreductase